MFTNSASFTIPVPPEEKTINELLITQIADATQSPEWHEQETEGQLSVDVLETKDELVIIATMAGTKPQDIELHLHNDFLTIRGRRSHPVENVEEFFMQECYWGLFSRTIVLPTDVKSELGQSEYRNGVLTIRLPKSSPRTSIPILVVEE